MLLKSS